MIYNIYDLHKGDVVVTASEQEAIDKAKVLMGTGIADTARVFMFEELNSRDDYYDMVDAEDVDRTNGYTLKNFIRLSGLETKETKTNADAWEKVNTIDNDLLHHLDAHEQLEVLHFIPDNMLVEEFSRRLKEYRRVNDGVVDVLDSLEIFV